MKKYKMLQFENGQKVHIYAYFSMDTVAHTGPSLEASAGTGMLVVLGTLFWIV